MQTRKKHTGKATELPADFLQTVADLFNKQFAEQRGTAEFFVYGALYMDEILLCVSLVRLKVLAAGTIYVSMDPPKNLGKQADRVTAHLQTMVDLVASWFHQCFQEAKVQGLEAVLGSIKEQPDTWQETQWEKQKFYVRINNENRVLDNAADKFLREKGLDPDSDEFLTSEGTEDDERGKGPLH